MAQVEPVPTIRFHDRTVAERHFSKRTGRRYARGVTALDLRRLRLRPGEVRRERVEVELEPFVLGGQRYEPTPVAVPADLQITQASALVLDLRLRAHLAGRACGASASQSSRSTSPRASSTTERRLRQMRDELSSDYVVENSLEVDSWARDAVARSFGAGALPPRLRRLCPVCGRT